MTPTRIAFLLESHMSFQGMSILVCMSSVFLISFQFIQMGCRRQTLRLGIVADHVPHLSRMRGIRDILQQKGRHGKRDGILRALDHGCHVCRVSASEKRLLQVMTVSLAAG